MSFGVLRIMAPKVRRDAFAADRVEDTGIRRISTERDGGDLEYTDTEAFGDDAIIRRS